MDVPAINLVVHWDAADTLLDYVQQTGRAGRDGSPCICITFYSTELMYKSIRSARKASDEDKREYLVACLKKVRYQSLENYLLDYLVVTVSCISAIFSVSYLFLDSCIYKKIRMCIFI